MTMNRAQADEIVDRIFDIWPATKIARTEWLDAIKMQDFHRTADGITRLRDHPEHGQWPPTIATVLSYIPRPAPPPMRRSDQDPFLANPAADDETRWQIKPEVCADGLARIAEIRRLMDEARSKRPTPGSLITKPAPAPDQEEF